MNRAAIAVSVLFLCSAGAAAQIVAYHDADSATHQQHFDTLPGQGYRPLTLSIFGSATNLRYAAVWIQRPGPLFVGIHDATAAQWQTFIDTHAPSGYRPRILTATGTALSPRFAAVLELTNAPGWTSHGLTEQTYGEERELAREAGFDVTAVDVYGTAADPRYIATFGPSPGQSPKRSATPAEWQDHFDAFAEGHARPALVGFDDHGRFVSLWRSDDVGDWVAHHDLTGAQYQALFDQYVPHGRIPISLQGSGSGAGARYAAVFAPSDLPVALPVTITGEAVPALAAFDTWAVDWMTASEVRAASLAVVKDGRLVLARGYTRGQRNYPVTQPDSLFGIASCSKPLTSICVHQHISRGAMSAQSPLMTFMPGGLVPADARVAWITLHSLLTHQGGWDYDLSRTDWMLGRDATIGTALAVPLPIQASHVRDYALGTQLLDFEPNTRSKYANIGFMLLGRVLEQRNPRLTYTQVVQRDLFTPLGITRARNAGSLLSQQHPGEVRYHRYEPSISVSVMSPAQPWVADQYGGLNEGNMDSHGGWVLASVDYAKVLAAFDLGAANPVLDPQQTAAMWTVPPGLGTTMRGWFVESVDDGRGGTVEMYHHNGRLRGQVSFVARRADGVSFVFLTNGDKNGLFVDPHGLQLNALANAVPIWPNHDLFPSVGLPSLRSHVPGSVNTFGLACAGANGLPTLIGQGTPEVGQPMSFRLGNGPASQPMLTALGLQLTTTSLAPIGAPGCTLYTDPLLLLFGATDSAGSAVTPWLVPDNPSLLGALILVQSAVLDPAANPAGLITTNGVDVTLGGWR